MNVGGEGDDLSSQVEEDAAVKALAGGLCQIVQARGVNSSQGRCSLDLDADDTSLGILEDDVYLASRCRMVDR